MNTTSIIRLPYGETELTLAADNAAVLFSRMGKIKNTFSGFNIVAAAMATPIASPRLSELAVGKRNAVIIISDHTRPVPSKDIIPHMLRELREGNPHINVTLLVATGFHRLTNRTELTAKLGFEIVEHEHIIIHDSADASSNVKIGVLPSGAPLVIDRVAAEADLLIAEGFIEPHFFAGFSGGRKSVLPGICDRITVFGNHCSRFIDSPCARTGILDGNPIHRDMLAAARLAKLAYIVNVVIDEKKKTVAAFAGNFEQAHRLGCDFLSGYCKVKAIPADIILTTNGGAPMDQNIYQCVKGLTAAEATAAENAVLIIAAECVDGHGGEGFYHSLKNCSSPSQLYAHFMATPQEDTIPDQWESQILARILIKHRIIFVTRPEMAGIVRKMKMIYAATIEEALKKARQIKGRQASLTIIPNGVSVIIKNDR